jgi:hypothetical protein
MTYFKIALLDLAMFSVSEAIVLDIDFGSEFVKIP